MECVDWGSDQSWGEAVEEVVVVTVAVEKVVEEVLTVAVAVNVAVAVSTRMVVERKELTYFSSISYQFLSPFLSFLLFQYSSQFRFRSVPVPQFHGSFS